MSLPIHPPLLLARFSWLHFRLMSQLICFQQLHLPQLRKGDKVTVNHASVDWSIHGNSAYELVHSHFLLIKNEITILVSSLALSILGSVPPILITGLRVMIACCISFKHKKKCLISQYLYFRLEVDKWNIATNSSRSSSCVV